MASLVTMLTLFAATILDFIVQKIGGVAQPHLFAASFASHAPGVKLVSWIAALGIFALFWYVGTLYHERLAALFPGLRILDDLSYKMIMVGFPLLTLGIVTGAAWANYAWGTYWSWDPKETWSLITWLIYAAFLHARFTAGWRGKKHRHALRDRLRGGDLHLYRRELRALGPPQLRLIVGEPRRAAGEREERAGLRGDVRWSVAQRRLATCRVPSSTARCSS